MNIVFQQSLRPEIPTVYGPIEYRRFRDQLENIDRILEDSKIEECFLSKTIGYVPVKGVISKNKAFIS